MVTPFFSRLAKFAAKPWRSQFRSFGFRWIRVFPGIPIPFRLPSSSWWLLRNDHIGAALLNGCFEEAEYEFVERFLRSGMTVLDIGANQGYYTLLASRRVGPQGKVFAFEPSPREVRRLKVHLWLNRCQNVDVATFALGTDRGTAKLHVVLGTDSGCNSLRPPEVAQPTHVLRVAVERLDDVLNARGVDHVDFIKLDVEGAELSVLHGAQDLLDRHPRPVILAEVQDIRTKPWGHAAREIIKHLSGKGYKWFAISKGGTLAPLDVSNETFDGNFVACPQESTSLPSITAHSSQP